MMSNTWHNDILYNLIRRVIALELAANSSKPGTKDKDKDQVAIEELTKENNRLRDVANKALSNSTILTRRVTVLEDANEYWEGQRNQLLNQIKALKDNEKDAAAAITVSTSFLTERREEVSELMRLRDRQRADYAELDRRFCRLLAEKISHLEKITDLESACRRHEEAYSNLAENNTALQNRNDAQFEIIQRMREERPT